MRWSRVLRRAEIGVLEASGIGALQAPNLRPRKDIYRGTPWGKGVNGPRRHL